MFLCKVEELKFIPRVCVLRFDEYIIDDLVSSYLYTSLQRTST